MKKQDIRKMKEIIVVGEVKIPDGYILIKEPTKMTENGVDVFKAVIGTC